MEANKLKKLGVKFKEDKSSLRLEHNGYEVVYWKKSKWFSGKTVTDGRGLENLIKQLNGKEEKHISFYDNNPESYNHLIGIFQKHTSIKLTDKQSESMKKEMKARFNIRLAKS